MFKKRAFIQSMKELVTGQTLSQEIANSITHGIGALLSIAAIVLLVVSASFEGPAIKVVSFGIYGTTLFFVFISSTLFHALRPFKAKALFLIFDHISIFFLIAGTYTPIALVFVGGAIGWVLFGLVWGIAIVGTLLKIFRPASRRDTISLVTYIVMGWIAIFFIDEIFLNMQRVGFMLLLVGGVIYTIGTLFLNNRRIPFSHAIWHLFVIGGAVCHFFGIYRYM